jgi:hypothetical protein
VTAVAPSRCAASSPLRIAGIRDCRRDRLPAFPGHNHDAGAGAFSANRRGQHFGVAIKCGKAHFNLQPSTGPNNLTFCPPFVPLWWNGKSRADVCPGEFKGGLRLTGLLFPPYLAAVLPGLADTSIQRLPELTPTALPTLCSVTGV